MRVLLLGDSHLARFHEYPFVVARDCTVRAVAGSSATDLMDQLGDLDPTGFEVIAVSVGTNDCGIKPRTLPEFLDAIEALLERVAPTPVLIVNNPGADERASDYDDVQMKKYAAEAAAVVRAHSGSVLDIPSVIAPLGMAGRTADGVHVSKFGHIALIPALRRALRKARKP